MAAPCERLVNCITSYYEGSHVGMDPTLQRAKCLITVGKIKIVISLLFLIGSVYLVGIQSAIDYKNERSFIPGKTQTSWDLASPILNLIVGIIASLFFNYLGRRDIEQARSLISNNVVRF